MENLGREGWSVDQQVLEQHASEFSEDSVDERQLLLDTDLKKVGVPCLPTDINHADYKQVKGPHVLQVVSATDACLPSKGGSGSSKNRLLLIKLTDGKITTKAVEFKSLGHVDIQMVPPGTKIQLSNATVRCGCILLEPKSFKILGGHVQALIEAYEFQQRFQGDRSATESSNEDLKAPKFTHFVAGKTRFPNKYLNQDTNGSTRSDRASADGPPGLVSKSSDTSNSVNPLSRNTQQPGHRDPQESEVKEVSESTQALQRQQAERVQGGGDAKTQLQQVKAQGAAKQKLTERLQMSEEENRRGRGRGRGRSRGGRRRGRDEEDNPGSMTLAEWEAKQSRGRGLTADEELAHRLQEQFDIEESSDQPQIQESSRNLAQELNQSMFSYSRPQEEVARGRGRGRGRSRGRSRGRY